jgi:adenine deaminase
VLSDLKMYYRTESEAMKISGNIVDVVHKSISPGTLWVENGRIAAVNREAGKYDTFILPGFIDAHIHIESSLLVPSEFARLVVGHGTVAVVADPHEIANVLGVEGIDYMIGNSGQTPLKIYFGAPSCVPATSFETAGATFGPAEIDMLLARSDIRFLSEMMNYPAVIAGDPLVAAILRIARKHNKPVDGHAPDLRGAELTRYIAAGITTDHETVAVDEGEEKIKKGMKLIIRQGSAARNFDALRPLLDRYPAHCMLGSDDIYPDQLVSGHINTMVRRAVANGTDPMNVLQAACINPVRHYGLDVGLLQPGDPADFIVVDNLKYFNIITTCIQGRPVADRGMPLLPPAGGAPIRSIRAERKKRADFVVKPAGGKMRVIEAIDGQILTNQTYAAPRIVDSQVVSNPAEDVLKFAVVNRYTADVAPAIGFLKGFGLQQGALVSSVGHDSHNILAIGVTDEALCAAVNLIIDHQGGLAAVSEDDEVVLPLPVAGLMAYADGFAVAARFAALHRFAGKLGCRLKAPFMTLSFMSLLVAPRLKLSDKGLFDSEHFRFVDLFV